MTPGYVSLRRLVRPAWCVLAVALATAWVWQRYAVVRVARDVELAQGRVAQLVRLRDQLLVEAASLSARERIERIATTQLGLQPTPRSRRRVLTMPGPSRSAPDRGTLAEHSNH
ncbi:MAG: cell division protein FtsL [candidate division Zixibacteria bacterium]|nr:cell division protein FtsL [candidate division Zixibacteria bacterium]